MQHIPEKITCKMSGPQTVV